MSFRNLLTRKNIIIASVVLLVGIAVALYFITRRPPRVEMDRYTPFNVLAFVQIDSLTDIFDGLTDTKAWDELAPALGLSSQLRQIGFAADLMSRTGFGPEEAVIAGRAQYAVVVTGIEAETGAAEEGPYVRFKPRFALIVETHSNAETAERLVRERTSILAQRIYGASATEESENYFDSRMLTFHGPQSERQLVAAAAGSVIVISNNKEATKSCLDAIGGRLPSLAQNETLKQLRPNVDKNSSVFAYLTEAGIEKLAEMSPAILASRFTTDPDRIGAIANLFGHMSKQATSGLLYSSTFDGDGVTERYITVLRPPVASGLSEALAPASVSATDALRFIPRSIEDFTFLRVERAGDLPERVLKHLSPGLDIVGGLALREFVLSFREQLGLEPSDSLGDAVGSEVLLTRTNDAEPVVMLIRIKDRARVDPVVKKYLSQRGATISTESYNGTEITASSNEDGRAAAFVGDFLLLATRDQIKIMIDAGTSNDSLATDDRIKRAIANLPSGSAVLSCKPREQEAGELFLAISKLTRTTDGSRELLDQPFIRKAIESLPPSISSTEFREYGIYTETKSAVGNFSLITSLISSDEEKQ
jgi:hypothetical protein